MKPKYLISAALAALALTSCENGTVDFDDFDYQVVYFANQYALRTIELGVDEKVDLTSDNNHLFSIKATWAGGYSNSKNVLIDYVVDESLVDGLYFKNTDVPLQVMPSDYYSIEDPQIRIPSGQIMGGATVKLSDKFFQDANCVNNCYVIPLRMTSAEGVDSILSGVPLQANAVLTDETQWSTQPKNFVLYCVKYVNPWHGQYLRRGVDRVSIAGVSSTNVRHQLHVENDEVVNVSTSAFKEDVLPISIKDAAGNNVAVNLKLAFTDEGACSVSSADEGAVVAGSGKFVSLGEKNSLGGKDRDAIYLDYTVQLPDMNMQVVSSDTLVLRTRNVYGGATLGVERK